MKESVFDLQTDITNLIIKNGLQDKDFAMVYQNGHLMVIDLSQEKIQQAVKNISQKDENAI